MGKRRRKEGRRRGKKRLIFSSRSINFLTLILSLRSKIICAFGAQFSKNIPQGYDEAGDRVAGSGGPQA